jgi:hypothetical protein
VLVRGTLRLVIESFKVEMVGIAQSPGRVEYGELLFDAGMLYG